MPSPGTMRNACLTALLILTAKDASAIARDCPYEAIVESDAAPARCGPGKNYYVTSKLKRGDRVTVRRQDLGGWFMVEPPRGSFSLIRAADVDRDGYAGTVKRLDQGQAVVRVGSAIDPAADSIFQRELSSGEHVEILGETRIPHRDTQIHMLKIRPPKGEFRWIEGKYLAPLDSPTRGREETAADPFTTTPQTRLTSEEYPPRRRRDHAATHNPPASNSAVANPVVNAAVNPSAVVPSAPVLMPSNDQSLTTASTSTVSSDPLSRLEQLDRQFRDMTQLRPDRWKLNPFERSYQDLQRQSSEPAITAQIERRLSAINRYKRVKAEYDEYFLLVSSTARKDAELAAVQHAFVPQNTRPPIDPAAIAAPSPGTPQNGYSLGAFSPRSMPQGNIPQNSLTQNRLTQNNFIPNDASQNNFQPNNFSQNRFPPNGLAQNSLPPGYFAQNGSPQNGADPQIGFIPPNGAVDGSVNKPPVPSPNLIPTNSQEYPSGLQQPAPQPTANSPALNGPFLGLPPDANMSPQTALEQKSRDTMSAGVPQMPAREPNPNVAGPLEVARKATNSDASNSPGPFVPIPTEPAPANPMPTSSMLNGPIPNNASPNALTLNTPVPSDAFGAPPKEFSANQIPNAPGPDLSTNVTSTAMQQNATFPQPPPQNVPAAMTPPMLQTPGLPGAAMNPPLAPPRQVRQPGGLDGAGVIQRAATPIPGGPQHVLLATNGRILAYLYPDRGIDLEPYIGRQMGIIGQRSFQPEWQTDLIVVQRVLPVRLVP